MKVLNFILLLSLCLGPSCKKIITQPPNTNDWDYGTLGIVLLLDTMRVTPAFGELSTTDYYATDSGFTFAAIADQNAYTWQKDIQSSSLAADWHALYSEILNANAMLEVLDRTVVSDSNRNGWKIYKGSALFIRGYAYFNLAQIFSLAYDNATSNTDLGVPLEFSSVANIQEKRSSLKETYNQILSDLKGARELLPDYLGIDVQDGIATKALLSRVYLSMRDYNNAGLYADSALRANSELEDYNLVPEDYPFPFFKYSKEMLYQSHFSTPLTDWLYGISGRCSVDSNLYNSYDTNDLRRSAFFIKQGGLIYRLADYTGSYLAFFSGLAVDEMYLNRAECAARAGNKDAAMVDLNTLLVKRWKWGTFVPFIATDANDALVQVLAERRKELCFRGLHWMDTRRLNKEGGNIVLTRTVKGSNYSLPANSPRYALPIPSEVVQYYKMQQNPR